NAELAHTAAAASAIVSRPLIGWSPPRELLEKALDATIEPKRMSIENQCASRYAKIEDMRGYSNISLVSGPAILHCASRACAHSPNEINPKSTRVLHDRRVDAAPVRHTGDRQNRGASECRLPGRPLQRHAADHTQGPERSLRPRCY